MNGITPMKIHVDFTHFYLVAKRKLTLIGNIWINILKHLALNIQGRKRLGWVV